MATDYFVLVPKASEMNVSGTVPDAFIVSVAQGSPVDKQLTGNYTGKVTVGGKSGYLRAGPYTSRADAQAYLKVGAKDASTPIPGVSIKPGGGVTVHNPLTGLDAIGAFFNTLTQSNTWVRVAKVIVGGALLIAGIAHITGASGQIMDVARKVPLPI
jgi:hypothetical protein